MKAAFLSPILLLVAHTQAWAQQSSGTTTAELQDAPRLSNSTESMQNAHDDAAEAFWKGKEFYDAGEFSLAIEQFQLAYSATKEPALLYDIAQSYRKLGQCLPALENYRNLLRVAPESPLAAQAEKRVSELQESCPTTDAAPSAQAQDHQAPVQPAAPAKAPPERTKFAATSNPNHTSDDSLSTQRVLSLIALSGAVVAGGIAAGLEIWNQGRYNDWHTRDKSLAQGVAKGEEPSDWVARQQSNDDLAHSIQRVDHEAIFFSVGAGALLGAAAVLYWLPQKAPRRDSVSEVTARPVSATHLVLQLRGLAVMGTF